MRHADRIWPLRAGSDSHARDQFRTEGGATLRLPKSMGAGNAVYGIRPAYIRRGPEGGLDARVHLVALSPAF